MINNEELKTKANILQNKSKSKSILQDLRNGRFGQLLMNITLLVKLWTIGRSLGTNGKKKTSLNFRYKKHFLCLYLKLNIFLSEFLKILYCEGVVKQPIASYSHYLNVAIKKIVKSNDTILSCIFSVFIFKIKYIFICCSFFIFQKALSLKTSKLEIIRKSGK